MPLAIAVLLVMGMTPALRVRDRTRALRRLVVPGGVALATVAAVGLLSQPGLPALTAFGAAAFVLTGVAGELVDRLPPSARDRRPARLAGLVAHAGIALVAVGVAGSSAYGRDTERTIRTGEVLQVADVTVRLLGVDRAGGSGGMAVHARLQLTEADGAERTVTPALRYHPARDTAVTEPAIDTGLFRDTYVTLIAVAPDSGSATLRLAVNPLVGLLWAGGALTATGGLLSAIGAARSRRRTPTPGASARPTPVASAPEPQRERPGLRRTRLLRAGPAVVLTVTSPSARSWPSGCGRPRRRRPPAPGPRPSRPPLSPAPRWTGAGSTWPTPAAMCCWSTSLPPGAGPAVTSCHCWSTPGDAGPRRGCDWSG
ncbi:hypothetical protein JNW88_13795 [Micromonospora sp. ATA32]|nr:hypothetical protein [Micromonospora sp. ATA32]